MWGQTLWEETHTNVEFHFILEVQGFQLGVRNRLITVTTLK